MVISITPSGTGTLDIITFGIALIPVLRLKIPKVGSNLESDVQDAQDTQDTQNGHGESSIPNQTEKISYVTEIKDGIKLIREIPGMAGALTLGIFLNFIFMPFDALMINFIKVTHSGTELELGYFMGAIQIGMFAGAIIVSVVKKWKNWTFWVSFGLIVEGIAFFALGTISDGIFWLLYLTGGIMLILNPTINSLFQTTIQTIIPPDKMGRIIALLSTLTGIASPIGLLIAGPIADALGSIKLVFMGCGILSIIASLIAIFGKNFHTILSKGEEQANKTETPEEQEQIISPN